MKTYLFIFSLVLTLPLWSATIVKDGKATSCIVIPQEPQPSVLVAAEELVYHINKATNNKLQVYNEDKIPATAPKMRIYLGDCKINKKLNIDTKKLKPAEFLIRSTKDYLVIAGRDRNTGPVGSSWHSTWHGTLWGVYEFLEKEMNVRWLWPGEIGEFIPKTKNINLRAINIA